MRTATHRVDDDLIEACRRGDREALRRLFVEFKDVVYSTALHFLGGDRELAADVTQDVFVKLAARIGQYRGEAQFVTWLRRIVVNACVDEKRRVKRFVRLPDEAGALESMAGVTAAPDLELTRAVAAAVSRLNPLTRMTVMLKYVDDLSYEEIARTMGCPKGTVASRLNRAHGALAQWLGRPARSSATGGDHV